MNNFKKLYNNYQKPLEIIKTYIHQLVFILLFLICGVFGFAQSDTPIKTRILFIYDASNSMNGTWKNGVKHEVAYKLMHESLDSLNKTPNLELALRAYGHSKYYKSGQDCEDTELLVPFADNNVQPIKTALKKIQPKGTTLIAYSLEQAANDFPSCKNCRDIIVLITDGIEECNGDPCAISLALQQKGIILKPFVIGIGLDMKFAESFKCVGTYYDAANPETFKTALNIVISQALNNTSSQVNLLNKSGIPSETNVNMTFYNSKTGKIEYNYIHTMNHRGNPDTIQLDPAVNYNLVVHTIPKVTKDNISIIPGTHNIIAVDAPQGSLEVKFHGGSLQYKGVKTIVRKNEEMETLNVQDVGDIEKYIVGNYDLEIFTLPRTYINKVQINQSHTTTIELPKPGLANIVTNSYGFGSLYQENDGKLEWIYNLKTNVTRETLYLQPGHYRIIFRPTSAKQSLFTVEKKFEIKPGGSETIKIY
jgi:Ca-activated chloride channel homolog